MLEYKHYFCTFTPYDGEPWSRYETTKAKNSTPTSIMKKLEKKLIELGIRHTIKEISVELHD